jgi:hypothetical protein
LLPQLRVPRAAPTMSTSFASKPLCVPRTVPLSSRPVNGPRAESPFSR